MLPNGIASVFRAVRTHVRTHVMTWIIQKTDAFRVCAADFCFIVTLSSSRLSFYVLFKFFVLFITQQLRR